MENLINVKIDKKSVKIEQIYDIAASLVRNMQNKKMTFASAESCTGGLVGSIITEISGASAVYLGGIITYTNDVKINTLGVDRSLIEMHSEVSAPVALDMARNVREKLCADFGVSATGFAGPTGGNENDPVGTVYVGIANDGVNVYRLSFESGVSRAQIRLMTVEFILSSLLSLCA